MADSSESTGGMDRQPDWSKQRDAQRFATCLPDDLVEWEIHMICCQFDEGHQAFDTWEDADAGRQFWIALGKQDNHVRHATLHRCDPLVPRGWHGATAHEPPAQSTSIKQEDD